MRCHDKISLTHPPFSPFPNPPHLPACQCLTPCLAHSCHSQSNGLVCVQVAACICLFALDKYEAIPVDTHVWQLAVRYYTPHLKGTACYSSTQCSYTYSKPDVSTWSCCLLQKAQLFTSSGVCFCPVDVVTAGAKPGIALTHRLPTCLQPMHFAAHSVHQAHCQV